MKSWEEKGFAKDSESFGVCRWPPRSYTCSFCMRDFRSAQALGGHMNIHRRDRAKLKQSLIFRSDNYVSQSPPHNIHNDHELISSKPISIDFTNIIYKVVGSSHEHEVASISDFASAASSQKKQRNEIIHDQLKSTTAASNLELDLELRLGRHTAAPK